MASSPYRRRVQPAPQKVDVADASRLGDERSVHKTPPLWAVLFAPIVLTLVVCLLAASAGVPALLCSAVGLAILALVAWPALRDRGLRVVLRARGIEVHRPGTRDAFAFEDVDEVWLELSPLHPRSGAPVRAIRVVEYGGVTHRVPTAVSDSVLLVTSLIRLCQGPLLAEAQEAIKRGEELNFGLVRINPDSVTVKGASRKWRDIRSVVVSHGRAHIYGRAPLLAWRTIHLDRVPNAPVLLGIIAQRTSAIRLEDRFILPDYSDRRMATSTDDDRRAAFRVMGTGAAVGLLALVVTLATYSPGSRVHLIAIGPILWGGVRFVQGLALLRRSPPRR